QVRPAVVVGAHVLAQAEAQGVAGVAGDAPVEGAFAVDLAQVVDLDVVDAGRVALIVVLDTFGVVDAPARVGPELHGGERAEVGGGVLVEVKAERDRCAAFDEVDVPRDSGGK